MTSVMTLAARMSKEVAIYGTERVGQHASPSGSREHTHHRCTDETTAKIAGRQRQEGYAASHSGRTAFVGIQMDTLDLGARANAHQRMAELVKADGQELEGIKLGEKVSGNGLRVWSQTTNAQST